MRLLRQEIPHKDIAIQPCGDHFGIILININGRHSGLMQIQRAHKLLIIQIINRDPAILIPHINPILRRLDHPDIDIAPILIQILKYLTSLESNDGNVLVDSSDDDFAYIRGEVRLGRTEKLH